MSTALLTERLSIRLVTRHELQPVHELLSLPETDEYNTLGIPENIGITKRILKSWIAENRTGKSHTCSIFLRDTGDFIGLIALQCGHARFRSAAVWYKLHVQHWGKGYATEALKGIISFGFNTLQLHRIEAGCAVNNTASMRVMEKAGMQREGRKRKCLPLKSGWADNYDYAILAEDKGSAAS